MGFGIVLDGAGLTLRDNLAGRCRTETFLDYVALHVVTESGLAFARAAVRIRHAVLVIRLAVAGHHVYQIGDSFDNHKFHAAYGYPCLLIQARHAFAQHSIRTYGIEFGAVHGGSALYSDHGVADYFVT
jgi:hypothetical protein